MTLIGEILAYLRDLKDNNNREWFNAHKERYTELKDKFEGLVAGLIDEVAIFDAEVKGLAVKDCVYRIYRDVRFSPNKEPYKTHFGAYICAPNGRKSPRCGYYVHIEPGNCLFGGGCYCPEPALLKRLRKDIYDNVEEFTSILREPVFLAEFKEIDPTDKLKKVPAPFPADFPEADLLKYKHYDVASVKPDAWFEQEGFVKEAARVLQKLSGFNRFLNYTIDEA